MRPAVVCYVALRALLLGVALCEAFVHHEPTAVLLTPWDAHFYAQIAARGYPSAVDVHVHSAIPFFPLYPILGRGLHDVTQLPIAWALLVVGWLAGLAMLVPAALLVEAHWRAERAGCAAIFLAVFPGAVVTALTYADGLGGVLACACLLALERRRYVWAGVAGAAAGAAFSLATPPLLAAVAAFALVRRQPRALLAGAIVPVGIAGYFGYLWAHTGSALTWFRVEHSAWDIHLSLPTAAGTNFHDYAFVHLKVAIVTILTIAVVVAGFVALARLRAPAHWIVYSAVVVAAATFNGGNHLTPRLAFDAFPSVLALGASIPRRLLLSVCVACAAAACLLFVFYSRHDLGLLAP